MYKFEKNDAMADCVECWKASVFAETTKLEIPFEHSVTRYIWQHLLVMGGWACVCVFSTSDYF